MSTLNNILILFVAIFFYLLIARFLRKLLHAPAPPIIGRGLDSNFRRWMQPAEKVVARSGIRNGMTVLDLGCGSGAYTTFFARAAGEIGKVYAIDLQPKMLAQLARKLLKPENADIHNIEFKEADAYHLPFENDFFDAVCMVTVLPEIPDKHKALSEVLRVLKPGGFLAVTEFFPDPDYPWRSTTIKLGTREGFILDASEGNFWNYTVRFKKPS